MDISNVRKSETQKHKSLVIPSMIETNSLNLWHLGDNLKCLSNEETIERQITCSVLPLPSGRVCFEQKGYRLQYLVARKMCQPELFSLPDTCL